LTDCHRHTDLYIELTNRNTTFHFIILGATHVKLLQKTENIDLYEFYIKISLYCLLPLLGRLPFPLAWKLNRIRGAFRYHIGWYRAYINRPGLKEIAIQNVIQAGFTRSAAKRIVKDVFVVETGFELEGLLHDKFNADWLEENLLTIHNMSNLINAMEKGKGVILATAHTANFELVELYVALRGIPISGLYGLPQHKPRNSMERFALERFARISDKIGAIYTSGGLRELYKVLERGECVMWLIDLPAGNNKRSVHVKFMEETISVANSFVTVSAKADAPIVPMISVARKRPGYQVFFGRPILPGSSPQESFSFMESHLRKSPESWIGWYYLDRMKV